MTKRKIIFTKSGDFGDFTEYFPGVDSRSVIQEHIPGVYSRIVIPDYIHGSDYLPRTIPWESMS